jgi:hypothetical protein
MLPPPRFALAGGGQGGSNGTFLYQREKSGSYFLDSGDLGAATLPSSECGSAV